MTDSELRQMQELDNAADVAGGFLAPLTKNDTRYDYRALLKYCREKKSSLWILQFGNCIGSFWPNNFPLQFPLKAGHTQLWGGTH